MCIVHGTIFSLFNFTFYFLQVSYSTIFLFLMQYTQSVNEIGCEEAVALVISSATFIFHQAEFTCFMQLHG